MREASTLFMGPHGNNEQPKTNNELRKTKPMKTYKDLDAYKISMEFVTEIYQLTRSFPKEEIFGLTNQMRRAAISIPSNIAEGSSRNSKKEYKRFLYIALGSNSELNTQLTIARNLKLITEEQHRQHIDRSDSIGKMINGIIRYLKSSLPK